jgi:hypothetical protein
MEIAVRLGKGGMPLKKQSSFYLAHRVIVTPTLFKVLKLSLDETNRIIRHF